MSMFKTRSAFTGSASKAALATLALSSGLAALSPTLSNAFTMNASLVMGGSLLNGSATQNASSVSPLLGANLTVDLGTYLEAGLFYNHNFLSYSDSTSGCLLFYGALLRIGLLGTGSNLYADTEIGVTQRSGSPFTSEHGFGLGAGIGYRLWLLPYLDLSPRVGVRILPEPFQGVSYSSNALDGSLLLTFEF